MHEQGDPTTVRIEPWHASALDMLYALNIPEVKRHVGGPETEEQLLARHERYLRFSGTETGCMFQVVLLPAGVPVGTVGYWRRRWQGEPVYEMGWNTLPAYQGQGIATSAVRAAAARARARADLRYAHAFPAVDNPPSNAVCRRVGFRLLGECDFEYPPGRLMRSHDWQLDLTGAD